MIFISYSGRDADDADVVNRTLTAGGIATFLAPRDMIVGNYEATIVNRIRESDGMVLLLSADALKSHEVQNEVSLAVAHRKRIDAFRIKGLTPQDVYADENWEHRWCDTHTYEYKAPAQVLSIVRNGIATIDPLPPDARASAEGETDNAITQAILSRRSIRAGLQGPIARSTLEKVVECGLAGPSSKNAQPWRFHVVENANALLRIAESVMASDGLDQYRPHDPKTGAPYPHWQSTAAESAAVLSQAPAAVFIENRGVFSGGRRGLSDVPRDGLMQTITGYGLEMVGIGAAIENMWIAAVSLGVSAAFLADLVIAEEQIKAELAITGDVVGALALGYSRAVPPPALLSPPETLAAEPVVWHT